MESTNPKQNSYFSSKQNVCRIKSTLPVISCSGYKSGILSLKLTSDQTVAEWK